MSFPDGARGFRNPILGGGGALLRTLEKSKNFVTGVSGWAIYSNGDVEFNAGVFRGSIVAGTIGGKRIEINVTSGIINMFDASNRLIGTWDSNQQIFQMLGHNPTGAYLTIDVNSWPYVTLNSNVNLYQPVFMNAVDNAIAGGIQNVVISSGAPKTGVNNSVDGRFEIRSSSTDGTRPPIAYVRGSFNSPVVDLQVQGAVRAEDPILLAQTHETWHNVTFAAGWTNQTTTQPACRYRLLASPPNTVELIGRVAHAAVAGTSILTTALPVVYRPLVTQTLPIAALNSTVAPVASPVLSLDTAGVLTFSNLPTGTTQCSFHLFYSLDAT